MDSLYPYQNTASPCFGHIVIPKLGNMVAPPAATFVRKTTNVAIADVWPPSVECVSFALKATFELYDPPIPKF